MDKRALSAGRLIIGEQQILDEEGRLREFEVRKAPVYDERAQRRLGLITIGRDITEEKQAKVALRESEGRFRAIFEQAGIGVSMSDPRTGKFVQANQRYCQIVGYTFDELLALDFRSLTHPDDLALQDEMTAGLLEGKFSEYTLKKRYIRKDQSVIWVELTCSALWKPDEQPTQHIAVVQDITQSKQDEEELESHRDHLQELVNERTQDLYESEAEAKNALAALKFAMGALEHRQYALDQHAIVAIADVQGRINYANDRFCAVSGYSREELLGRDMILVNSGYHPHGFFKEMYLTVAQGQPWHAEVCDRAKDGRLYWVDSTVVPFMGEDGNPQEYISIQTDITERKRVELEAQAANRAKSEFLANMSHEIRTPMNGVVGMVDILQQTELSHQQHRMVRTIRDSALSLLSILNDILDFSKIEAGKLTVEAIPTHVREVAEGVAQLMIPTAASKNIDLHVFVDPDTPAWILSDPVRLRQVLFNLLGNAVKFTTTNGRHGQVMLRVEPMTLDDGRAGLRLCVKDNGIGMSPEIVKSLFRPFTQADESTTRKFGGTGLGLSITKRLVELLHGQVLVQSTIGEGSEFTVELPVEISAPGHQAAAEPDLSGVRVLAVTANPAYAEILTAYLRSAGAEVVIAAELATASQQLPQESGSVLLLDPELVQEQPALAEIGIPDTLRVVQFIHRRSSSSNNGNEITIPVSPLLQQDLIHGVAIAAGRLSVQDHVKERRQQPRTTAPTVEDARTSGRLILLAEDNETNREVIQEQLRILGYASEVAEDGQDALEKWRAGRYALLLTDCHMPKMDGFQLTAAIRAEEADGQHLPIIAVTANAMQGESERCIENGMDDYLSKPLRLNELGAMLATWLPRVVEAVTGPDAMVDVASAADIPVWDAEMLQRMVGGTPETHRRLLDKFLVSAEEMVAALGAAIAEADPALVANVAHKLKSPARTVGAMQLGELCQQLETAGRAGDMRTIYNLAQKLDADFQNAAALISKG